MIIGVISDTHIPQVTTRLPELALAALAGSDLIVHVGDLVSPVVIDWLEEIAPVEAVRGNMDGISIEALLPVKNVLILKGHRIGLIHGWGSPYDIEERISREFENVEAIIYGHTHRAVCHHRMGMLFFNPGSATDSRSSETCPSVGKLIITPESIKGEIIELK